MLVKSSDLSVNHSGRNHYSDDDNDAEEKEDLGTVKLSPSALGLPGNEGEKPTSSRFLGDCDARLPMELEWRSSAIARFGLKASLNSPIEFQRQRLLSF
nr:Ribulose bisphosphate carboxylase, large subunit, ferrodoxin-like N-terminal [Ipomoea trifida]